MGRGENEIYLQWRSNIFQKQLLVPCCTALVNKCKQCTVTHHKELKLLCVRTIIWNTHVLVTGKIIRIHFKRGIAKKKKSILASLTKEVLTEGMWCCTYNWEHMEISVVKATDFLAPFPQILNLPMTWRPDPPCSQGTQWFKWNTGLIRNAWRNCWPFYPFLLTLLSLHRIKYTLLD